MLEILAPNTQKKLKQGSEIQLKYGEFFSGPGGLGLGAKNALVQVGGITLKIHHEWASDYDEDSCLTYKENICPDHGKVICEDIRKLDIDSLSPVDIFAYGFPCNDFSLVGEKKGFDGTFGPLYTYGIKVINKFKPKAFIAENVGGLASSNEGKSFEKILSDLEKSGNGYNITVHLYKFEEYGVPQTRHRIIIVGIEKAFNTFFKVPAPTHINNYVSVKSAFENPPILKDAPNHEYTSMSKKSIERLKLIKPWENVWNAELPAHLKINAKGAKISQIYKRLHPDKPSYTITGSGGGGTHGYHWLEPRALTNRERARIQTFPDTFLFKGKKEKVRKQIGMAVPPKGAQIIFESVLKTLAGIPYESIAAKWDRETKVQ